MARNSNIPSPESVIFQFTKDLFTIIWHDKVLEQMTYTVENNKITMVKTSGSSHCPMLSQGTYKFTILNNKLNFEGITDGCNQRQSGLGYNIYSKVLPLEL